MRRTLPLVAILLSACAAHAPSDPRAAVRPASGRGPASVTPAFQPIGGADPPSDVIGPRASSITTLLGTGNAGYSGDGSDPRVAQLNGPTGLTIHQGDLLVVDRGNNRVRKLSYDGVLSTFLGSGSAGYNGDGADLTHLALRAPDKIVSDDTTGLLFFSDRGNQMIRCVDPSNHLLTVAGGGTVAPIPGGSAVAGLNAELHGPSGMAFDSAGNLYVAEQDGNRILKLNANHDWTLSVYAGTGTAGFAGEGTPAVNAQFDHPSDIAIDAEDTMYVADYGNHRIRRITTDGTVTTLAGTGTAGFSGDGASALSARLDHPAALAVDNQGDVFVADSGNQRVREIKTDGTIATLAGNGTAGYSGDNGPPLLASFHTPWSLAYSPAGGLYVADRDNHCVRHFNVP